MRLFGHRGMFQRHRFLSCRLFGQHGERRMIVIGSFRALCVYLYIVNRKIDDSARRSVSYWWFGATNKLSPAVKRIDVIVEAPFSSESSLCQWSRRSRLLRHSIVYQRRLANQHQPIRDSIIVVCPLRRRICLSPILPFWSPRPADRIRAINFVVRQRHRSKAARQMDLPKTLLVPKYPWNRKTDG